MTEKPTKADSIAWEHAFLEFRAAEADFKNLDAAVDEPIFNTVLDHYCEAEEALLALPAPGIAAVIDKLLIIWGDDIKYDHPESAQKRMVIGDLRRVAVVNGL